MTVRCPNCKAELDAPEECIGQQVECPKCGRSFTMRKAPSCVAVPTQNKRGLKRYQIWLLIAIGIIVIASPCAWFFGFVERNVDNVAIRTWMATLPQTADTIKLDGNYYHNFGSPKCEYLFPEKGCGYIYPPEPLNTHNYDMSKYEPEEFLYLKVTQTFTLGGMNGLIVSSHPNSPIQRTVAVIVDTPRAIGDSLLAGLYVYYGIQTLQLGALGEQALHLFVESQVFAKGKQIGFGEALAVLRQRDEQKRQAELAVIEAQKAAEREMARKEGGLKIMVAGERDIVLFKEKVNDILNGKAFTGFDANVIVGVATNADVRLEPLYNRIAWKYSTDSSLTDIESAAEKVKQEVSRLNARLVRLDEYRKAYEAKQQEKAERLEAATRLQFASNLISRIDFSVIKHKIVMHRYLAKYQTKRTNDYGFLENLYNLQQKQAWLKWVNTASAKSSSHEMFYDQLPDTNTISSIVESVRRSRVLVRFSFQELPSETEPVAVRINNDGQTFVVSEGGYGDLEVYTSLDAPISYVVERGAMNTLNAKIMIAKRQGHSTDDCLYAALSLDTSYDAETLRKAEMAEREKMEEKEKARKQRARQRARQEAAERAAKKEKYRLR